MNHNTEVVGEYLVNLISNTYPQLSVVGVRPITMNMKQMLQNISVGKQAFFGDIKINIRAWQVKAVGVLNSTLYYTDLFTSFNNQAQIMIATSFPPSINANMGSWTTSSEVITIPDVLFDDLITVPSTYFMNSGLVGSLTGPAAAVPTPYNGQSLQVFIPLGNGNFSTAYWSTILAANPKFLYAPELFYFTGYKVSFNN